MWRQPGQVIRPRPDQEFRFELMAVRMAAIGVLVHPDAPRGRRTVLGGEDVGTEAVRARRLGDAYGDPNGAAIAPAQEFTRSRERWCNRPLGRMRCHHLIDGVVAPLIGSAHIREVVRGRRGSMRPVLPRTQHTGAIATWVRPPRLEGEEFIVDLLGNVDYCPTTDRPGAPARVGGFRPCAGRAGPS